MLAISRGGFSFDALGRTADYRMSPSTKTFSSKSFVWAGLAVLRARKTSLRLSIPDVHHTDDVLWEHVFTTFKSVLPAGIEPASAPSEGAVLSIERRELAFTIRRF